MRKTYVVFLSPGTFIDEQTSREVKSRDLPEAVRMAKTITERHNAKPYGFYFSEYKSANPVPDGEGGFLEVEEKEEMARRSGTYFITGTLVRVEDVPDEGDTRILRSNMECNDMPLCVENRNSYRSTHPFLEKDFIVDWDGKIVERGDAPGHVAYRTRMIDKHRREMEKEMAKYAAKRKL